ncbi:hypothetical protein HAX54_016337 [Datura stramonium]|uniref:Uncharacterized protein n=1 Tax=Datura stramonium TaxID=4076 RepID=A0ABS8UKY7_DATST|nr:hypothetical protein [Datura stramonium]
MARHTSNGESDGRQPSDRPSLVPSRSSPFSLWATEVTMECQVNDGPSRYPPLRLVIEAILVKDGRRADGPSGPLGSESASR